MIEQKALSFVNMFGVLGALENLCAMDDKAKDILNGLKRQNGLENLQTLLKENLVKTLKISTKRLMQKKMKNAFAG